MEDIEKGIAGMCPLGRCAVPADIARVVAFLGSADSEWVNGESVLFSFLELLGDVNMPC